MRPVASSATAAKLSMIIAVASMTVGCHRDLSAARPLPAMTTRAGAATVGPAASGSDAIPVAPSPYVTWQALIIINDIDRAVRVSCGRCASTLLDPGQRVRFVADEELPAVFDDGASRGCQTVGPVVPGPSDGKMDKRGTQTLLVSEAHACS